MRKPFLFIVSVWFMPFFSLLTQFDPAERNNLAVSVHQVESHFAEEPKCTDCHVDMVTKKEIHAPAAESCDDCHQVNIKDHGKGAPGLKLTEKIPELCFTCHDDLKNNLDTIRYIHQAVTSGERCMNCHSPHSTDEKNLLVSEEKMLCLSCHNKDVSSDGKKVVNMQKLLAGKKVIHAPLESDGCTACHQPHGSSNDFLLNGAFPSGNYANVNRGNFAFCWECHDSDLYDVAVTASKTNFRNGATNLHYLHRLANNGRSCIVCHNVHATKNLHLIEDKVQYGKWELPVRYKPNENGGSCFPGCHSEKSYTR